MFSSWVGVVLGGGLVALGVGTMRGWQAASYKRPRLAGWGGVAVGVGFAGVAVVDLARSNSMALWACWGLMLVGSVLMVWSRPATRFSRRNRG